MIRFLSLALAFLWALPAVSQPLSFALFGDVPYSRWEREQLPPMLDDMARRGAVFAVHVGDIKSGSSLCSDEVLRDIRDVFRAAPLPLVYVPGDNEWTDCHRSSNGSYDPLERLARLRNLFFVDDLSLGQKPIALQRQSADPAWSSYRENQRWEQDGLLFVALNVPGSHNNYFGPSGRGGPSAEFRARSAANRVWVAQAFEHARQHHLAGVLILFQANPGFEAASAGQASPGFAELIEQLRQETEAYAGQVMVVHGDSHSYQINQPLLDAAGKKVLDNFTRVEVPGYPFMGWVHVTVDRSVPRGLRVERMHWNPQSTTAP